MAESFFPIGSCCLKGQILPGEPQGIMEPSTSNQKVTRYHAKPSEVIDSKTAIILFYDVFGFNIPNPKLLADRLAEALKIHVFVPDYVPNALGANDLETVVESFPGEHAQQSWFTTIFGILGLIFKILPRIGGIRKGSTVPMCLKAIEDLNLEGYEKVGAVGYCLGGSQIIQLMSKGDHSPVKAGVIVHPSPDAVATYQGITMPTKWLLASHDMRFKEPQMEEVRNVFKSKPHVEFDMVVYPETVHGFAARPNLGHEPTRKAFEEAGATTVEFFRKHLLE